jgi:cytochrome b subunit of formate dehydrogenase
MEKLRKILTVLGGLMLLVGACLMITKWKDAPYIYTIGAVLFGIMQVMDRYTGNSIVLKRLRVQQVVASLLLVVTGVLMFVMHHNEWIVCLTVAVVIELYTAFRIPQEYRKEEHQ